MILTRGRTTSPIGDIVFVTLDDVLVHLDFADHEDRTVMLLRRRFGPVTMTEHDEAARDAAVPAALHAYFAGDLQALAGLAVEPGGTPFQRRVWLALRDIEVGRTASYGELARRLGAPKAVRAVGRTNGLNPISLVLPCHRVIGGDGSLTGYAGGIERKAWLLRHEGVLL
ncbi:MAG: methylated-DNA--[protein]-cysteine S-methyltransferase [Geminicoccaceae bacterium]|nr:methylated-DNA--[protein]-cysteine S-methyltransferase [Geminicoccaceae bacterium]